MIELHVPPSLNERALESHIAAVLAGRYGWIFPRALLLAAPVREIEDALKKSFPRIGDVLVEKKFPDTLSVIITERTFFAVLCGTPKEETEISVPRCVSVDAQGVAYDNAPHVEGTLIRKIESDFENITFGETVVEPGLMYIIGVAIDQFDRAAGIKITTSVVSGRVPSEIRLKADDGFSIIMKTDNNPAESARVFKKVLDGEIRGRRRDLEYVDLRFGNKVFYKYR